MGTSQPSQPVQVGVGVHMGVEYRGGAKALPPSVLILKFYMLAVMSYIVILNRIFTMINSRLQN